MSALTDAVRQLPAGTRKTVYKVAKYVTAVAALVLLLAPALPSVGVGEVPTYVLGILSAVVAAGAHMADSNTFPEEQVATLPEE